MCSWCRHANLVLFLNDKNLYSWTNDKDPAQNYTFHRSYKLFKTSGSNGNKNNPVMVAGAKWSRTLKIAWLQSLVAWVLRAYHSKIIHLSFLPMVTRSQLCAVYPGVLQAQLWELKQNWILPAGCCLLPPFNIKTFSLVCPCCRWGKGFQSLISMDFISKSISLS